MYHEEKAAVCSSTMETRLRDGNESDDGFIARKWEWWVKVVMMGTGFVRGDVTESVKGKVNPCELGLKYWWGKFLGKVGMWK
jgi:hypothetical protein